MTAFHPLVPAKAVELLEAAGIPHAARLIRDHAAAGLVKSYAMVVETIQVSGATTCVRGAAVPVDLWRRIIAEGGDEDVWTGGTVRLAPGDLVGGVPAVNITGIGFNGADLQRLIDQHRGVASKRPMRPKVTASETVSLGDDPAPMPSPARKRREPDLSALHSGALHLTVEQTKAALSIGHTTFYKLLNAGDLERAPSKAGTRITAESVRRYAGIAQ